MARTTVVAYVSNIRTRHTSNHVDRDDICTNTNPTLSEECKFDAFGVFLPREGGARGLALALADWYRNDVARQMILFDHVEQNRVVVNYIPIDNTCTFPAYKLL